VVTTSGLHLTMSGIVQGVGYRQWFRRQALARALSGWVRNRADETVEAVIEGDAMAVEDLVRVAMAGPLGAKVDRIDRRAATAEEMAGVKAGEVEIRSTV